jgi:hypothetical protein
LIISLALLLVVTAGGTLATYAYDETATIPARVCMGVCTGIAALGLIAFVFASFLGLTPVAILLTVLVLASPVLLLTNSSAKAVVTADWRQAGRNFSKAIKHPTRIPFGYTLFYLVVAVILWRAFQRAMIDLPEGIFTGVLNNFGDLPFHLSVITGFAYGNNFPPDDPTFAGVRFTYPFLTDFISAVFVRCGAGLRQSMFIENFALSLAFVGVLHRWALELLRNRLAAVLTPVLVFLNGGFGWVLLWRAAKDQTTFRGILQQLPPSFTVIPETTWRWGNAVSALLLPQRGFLLGLPLAVIVFTLWWLATADGETGEGEIWGKADAAKRDATPAHGNAAKRTRSKKKSTGQRSDRRVSVSPRLPVSNTQRMIAAGLIAGLIPLVHAHTFVVVMVVGAVIGILQRRWRLWFIFGAVASVIALPQMWWSTHNSAVHAGRFFEWQYGWDHGNEDIVWFWLKNGGLFIPLTVVAILWRGKHPLVPRRLLLFLAPFSLCFIIPNVLKMAPWIWDNIKVLFYWWLASAPLVAILLARLWEKGKLQKLVALLLLLMVTAAGALDVGAIVLRSNRYEVFDAAGVSFAELVKANTEPKALIVHAPVHNHPVFLTGRRSLMGYPGHIWTHGLDYSQRESDIRRMYAGGSDSPLLMQRYEVQYAVVGPHERELMTVNDQFFSRFQLIGEVGGYRLYKVR